MNENPSITISSLDADRLETLIDSLPDGAFPGRDALEAELARAEIVEPKDVPPTVVTINSTVHFEVHPRICFFVSQNANFGPTAHVNEACSNLNAI